MTGALVFLFGLALGSFLNVCIHRLPRGESVVRPRSHCPHCNKQIAAYDNIPVLSWLLLRGRCRHCGAPIAWRYPLVELLTAALLLLTYWSFGLTQAGLKAALLASALLVLLFTDLELQKLPDAITLPGFVVGLLLALWIPVQDGSAKGLAGFLGLHMPPLAVSFTDALIGALFGAGFLILARQLYFWLRRREGLGLGDVKMMAMLGAFLGLKQVILIVFFSSLAGSIFSIPMFFMILVRFLVDPRQKTVWRRFSNSRKKPISRVRLSIVKVGRTPIPYGVFLALAALVAIFWGRPLVEAYLGLFR